MGGMGTDDGSQNRNGRDWCRIQWEPVGPETGTIGAGMGEEKVGGHYGIYGPGWERWSQNGNHGIKGWEER